jgi:hypothetical protein
MDEKRAENVARKEGNVLRVSRKKPVKLLDLWVPGIPVAQHRLGGTVRGGRAVLYDPNAPKMEVWRAQIVLAFYGVDVRSYDLSTKEARYSIIGAASQEREIPMGLTRVSTPVRIECDFYFPRPRYHYAAHGTSKTLRANAPTWHAVRRAEVDNLLKPVMDVLSCPIKGRPRKPALGGRAPRVRPVGFLLGDWLVVCDGPTQKWWTPPRGMTTPRPGARIRIYAVEDTYVRTR